MREAVEAARARFSARLEYAIARRLAVPLACVSIVRWDCDPKTHAEIPVFAVPASRLAEVLESFGVRAIARES